MKNASVYRPESTSKTRGEKFLKSFLILCTTVYKWHIWFPLGIFPKEKEKKRGNKGEIHLTLNPEMIIKGDFFLNCSSSLINCCAKILLTQQNCCHGNGSPATLLTLVKCSRVCCSPIPSALACIYSAPWRPYNGLPSLGIITMVFAFQISHTVWGPPKPMGKSIEEAGFDLQSL